MAEKETIREYFGLERASFMLDPQIDYECYAGRTEERDLLVERTQAAFDKESAPRVVLWGVYGGGKTHTQLFAGKKLFKEYGNDSVYIKCPDLAKNSSFSDVYKEILMTIGSSKIKELLQKYLLKVGDTKFKTFFSNQDTSNVCLKLILATEGSDDFVRAWRWLSGEQVSGSESIGLGATAALSPRESARFLIKFGEIHDEITKKKLVLLLDECEKFDAVSETYAIATFETAFREISEDENRHLGFICACTAVDYEKIAAPFNQASVSTRIGPNYLMISQLRDDQLKPFIKDLLSYVVDTKKKAKRLECLKGKGVTINEDFYPFSEEAVDVAAAHVCEDPRRKTPRIISDLLNDAATEAKRLGKDFIDEDAVTKAIGKRERTPKPEDSHRRRRS